MSTKIVKLKRFVGNSLILFDFELDLFLRNQKFAHIIPIAPSIGIEKTDQIVCPKFPLIPGKLVGIKEDFLVWDTRETKDGKFEVEFYFSYDAKVIKRQVPQYVYEKCKNLKEGSLVSRMLHRDKMPPEAFRYLVRIKRTTFKLLSQVTIKDLKRAGIFEEFIGEQDMGYNKADIEFAAMDYYKSVWRQRYRVHGYLYKDDPVVAVVEFRRSKEERYYKNAIPRKIRAKL